ncbi:MAG: T9SS type A sorting domain-containing protein [Saprospiraceae bacterium]|nr:T9SS type A sorting domain-containing protein [Saprospiraceae bacterium]
MKFFKAALLFISANFLVIHTSNSQCASGVTYITKVTSTTGAGTYDDPALGQIEFEFCFKLDEFFESQTNWVHGIFISFGDLQDGVTYELGESGEQNTQHGPRKWIYIDSLKAKQFKLPGVGFYVDDFDGNPKNNYGDNGKGTPRATFPDLKPFCFKAKYTCGYPRILRPTITVTGDGTTGGWSNPACPGDEFTSTQGGGNNSGYIVVCGTVLPLQLLSFSGNFENQRNYLNWTGLADEYFSHYELERRFSHEKTFVRIETFAIKSEYSGSFVHEIDYMDPTIPQSTTYYRLKMVEKDHTYTYSSAISIAASKSLKNNLEVKIFPQPADQLISVEWTSKSDQLNFEIYNIDGKLCGYGSLKSEAQKNFNSADIPIHYLPVGSYLIRFIEGLATVSPEFQVQQIKVIKFTKK